MVDNFNELLSERLKEISKQESFNQLMFVLVEQMLNQYFHYFLEKEKNVTNALDMSVAALEKQIPKKIKIIDGYDFCPTCSYKYGSDTMRRMLYHWDQPFCKKCGQRLDWKVDGKGRDNAENG